MKFRIFHLNKKWHWLVLTPISTPVDRSREQVWFKSGYGFITEQDCAEDVERLRGMLSCTTTVEVAR